MLDRCGERGPLFTPPAASRSAAPRHAWSTPSRWRTCQARRPSTASALARATRAAGEEALLHARRRGLNRRRLRRPRGARARDAPQAAARHCRHTSLLAAAVAVCAAVARRLHGCGRRRRGGQQRRRRRRGAAWGVGLGAELASRCAYDSEREQSGVCPVNYIYQPFSIPDILLPIPERPFANSPGRCRGRSPTPTPPHPYSVLESLDSPRLRLGGDSRRLEQYLASASASAAGPGS